MIGWRFVVVELAKGWRGESEGRAEVITMTADSMNTVTIIHSLNAFQLFTQ